MQISLQIQSGAVSEAGQIKQISLGESERFSVGRELDNDWAITDDGGGVSGRHFELLLSQGQVLLVDHSRGGTYLNGSVTRLNLGHPTQLTGSNIVQLGMAIIMISIQDDHKVNAVSSGINDVWGIASFGTSSKESGPLGLVSSPFNQLGLKDGDRDANLILRHRGRPREDAPPSRALDMDYKPPGQQRASDPPDLFQSGVTAEDVGGIRRTEPTRGATPSRGATRSGLAAPPPDSEPIHNDDDLFRMPDDRGDTIPKNTPVSQDDDPFADIFGSPERVVDSELLPEPEPPLAPEPQQHPALSNPRESVSITELPTGNPENRQFPVRDAAPADPDEFAIGVFDALGLDIREYSQEERLAMAAEIGKLFVTMADGWRQLLHERRDAKLNLGITNTVIEPGLNPLKWAPNAEAAVEGILLNRSLGSLHGQEAVDDAIAAIRTHQAALVVGIKLALEEGVAAFNPEQLEEQLASSSLQRLVPMSRKAALWDSFVDSYRNLARDIDSDIRRRVGRKLDTL